PYECELGLGCAKARLGPKRRSETCPYGGVGLGSFCLAACAYYDYSEIVPGKIGLQILSVYLHSPLSFSLCFGLGSFCLVTCAYFAVSGFIAGKAGFQMLSVYLHSHSRSSEYHIRLFQFLKDLL